MKVSLGSTTPFRALVLSVLTVSAFVSLLIIGFLISCDHCEVSTDDLPRAIGGGLALVLFALGIGLLFVGSLLVLYYTLSMATSPNEKIDRAPFWIRWNRNNLVFTPEYLSEAGLGARRQVIRGALMLAAGIALAFPSALFLDMF
ncbi:MAG: hypothetical protein AAF545_14105 [Pseudomonadota bacterium]